MIFAAVSSDAFNNIALNGSMLQLDSISLTGIAAQPAAFNGDFENWTPISYDQPTSWYIGGGGPNKTPSVFQTTDKQAGTYAAEVKSYMGDRCSGSNCYNVTNAGFISTGYYPNNCGGSCPQMGGYPFTNMIDTLCFYYKYAPMGNDTAQCGLHFKKNFASVSAAGDYMLGSYTYKEISFNTILPIDTVVVSFQSSAFRDTALSYIGSDLKVDEVHFKSQPLFTGVKTFDAALGVKIFPNPSNDGNFVVSNVQAYDLVRVYNVYGQEVNASIKKENDYAKIHIDALGAYFVYINARGKITTLKVIVSQQ
jgi:hypothetical protein